MFKMSESHSSDSCEKFSRVARSNSSKMRSSYMSPIVLSALVLPVGNRYCNILFSRNSRDCMKKLRSKASCVSRRATMLSPSDLKRIMRIIFGGDGVVGMFFSNSRIRVMTS